MSGALTTTLWTQFRRLFTGTVIELLQARGLWVQRLRVDFSEESRFDVPRFDNYMRFVGEASAELEVPLAPGQLDTIRKDLEAAWPGLVGCLEIPVGDRLTVDRVRVDVREEGNKLRIKFDLVAD